MEAFSDDESDSSDEELEILARYSAAGLRRIKKVYVRTESFNDLDDEAFRQRFRLTKEAIVSLLDVLEPRLRHTSSRNNPVSPMNQLLLTLRSTLLVHFKYTP